MSAVFASLICSKIAIFCFEKIQRVQNEVLYQQYEIQLKNKKKHMQTSDDVARALFHGTSREIAEKICMHGFDRGFAGKNGEWL